MTNINDPGKWIILIIAVAAIFFPEIATPIGIIGAVILAIILWIQHKLDSIYPYDMVEYVRAVSNEDFDRAIEVLSEHAAQCPYCDPSTCLYDTFCPDCPHGKRS